MSDTPFTNRMAHSNGGPFNSKDYNTWSESTYKDLVYLYNSSNQLKVDVDSAGSTFFKQILSISNELTRLETRLQVVENASQTMVYNVREQIDNDRFNGTPFEINPVSRNAVRPDGNTITLPMVIESSVSKIRFINQDGSFNVSNGLEVAVEQVETSLDKSTATVQTSSAYDAIQNRPGRVWERTVLANATAEDGASCILYVRIPNELSVTGNTNCISFAPFPIFDVDVMEVSYSTDPNAALTSATDWTPLNESGWYTGNPDSVGHLAPGSWVGDELINSGQHVFYFSPKAITAIRIQLRQNGYIERGSKYLYSYGLSSLDVRYDKFTKQGKSMIRFDAPAGQTISGIEGVLPSIWNVQQALVDDVFTYRVIWETAFNSGVYTTSPVALSQRVWLEVTLNEVVSGYSPVVSSISLNYT